jgi:alpha-1,3-rhamnosyltransferase
MEKAANQPDDRIGPLVSVLVPSYNHDKYITDTIESIIHQTYKNLELLVIDDGSTDNSVSILTKLQKKYNFKFDVRENKGIVYTMNQLFGIATGKYIAVCASDDSYMPDKIEKQVRFMEEHREVAMCFGNVLNIDAKGKIFPEKTQQVTGFRYYSFEDLFFFNFKLAPVTLFFRKEIAIKYGFLDDRSSIEDYAFWLKIAYHKCKIAALKDVLAYYRVHLTNTHFKTYFMYENFMKIFDLYKDHPLYGKAKRKRLLHYYPFLAVYHKKEARHMHSLAFSLNIRYFISLFLLMVPKGVSEFMVRNFFIRLFPDYFYLLNSPSNVDLSNNTGI